MLEPIPFAGYVEIDTECQSCKKKCICCDVEKILTDEEITDVLRASSDYVEFARAVLKLAQEK